MPEGVAPSAFGIHRANSAADGGSDPSHRSSVSLLACFIRACTAQAVPDFVHPHLQSRVIGHPMESSQARFAVERSAPSVLRITLTAEKTLNAVDTAVMNGIAEALERAGRDPEVRVIVITGRGRAFCAGADLGGADPGTEGPNTEILDAANRLTAALVSVPKPVICGLNGLAAGVGVSIALACDLVVASESAYFLLSFTNVGLMPDGGATALLSASLGRSRALRIGLLAERVNMTEAMREGLVTSVSAADSYSSDLEALVERMAVGPTLAFAETKQAINAASLPDLYTAYRRERDGQIRLLHGSDFAEGSAAFLAKRMPRFTGRED